jgi:exopolysaccharide biosynthesis polyprenyl glycosylphosphotransferase
MAEDAATITERAARSVPAKRSLAWVFVSVGGLVAIDVAISILSFVLAFKFRQDSTVFVWRRHEFFPRRLSYEFVPYLSILMFVPLVKVLAMRRFGLYKLRGEFSFPSDFANILKASTLSFLVLVLIAFLFRQGFSYSDGKLTMLDFSYSRLIFVADWLASSVLFCGARGLLRAGQTVCRFTGRNMIPTIVVGCGEMAQVCLAEIREKPRLGYKLVGVVTADGDEDSSALEDPDVRVLGDFENLAVLVKRFGVEEVLITDSRINPAKLFETLMECGRDHHIKYRVVPNLFNCLPGKTEIATIGSLPMIKLYEEPLRGPRRALKRTLDVAASLLVLLVTWPLWLALALLIKLQSKGPVFYNQERVGMDGKVFLMIKFRSMEDGASEEFHREVWSKMLNGEDANQGTAAEPVYGKVKNDPRLTRLGGWMRRYSIDELPQIFNVLKGEMSWVGPRPPIPYEVRLYKDWHRARFHVKPGITGLWQVSGRNRLHFEEMVRLDVFYIENWSPLMDLKIMLKTVPVVLKGDNKY